MKRMISAALGIIALCAIYCSSAWAGSNPWGDWQGNWQFQDANTAQQQLNAAALQYQFQHPNLTQPVTNIGQMNSTSIYNGPVSIPGSTNVINANDTSVRARDSMVTVTTTQASGTANQKAISKTISRQ